MTVFDFIFKFSLSILLSPSSIVRVVVTVTYSIDLRSLSRIEMRQPKQSFIFGLIRFYTIRCNVVSLRHSFSLSTEWNAIFGLIMLGNYFGARAVICEYEEMWNKPKPSDYENGILPTQFNLPNGRRASGELTKNGLHVEIDRFLSRMPCACKNVDCIMRSIVA